MSNWSAFPDNYREKEINQIRQAVCAGECVAVVGLSGSGKSNLLGFLAHRVELSPPCPGFVLIDCNRLVEPTPRAFYELIRQELEDGTSPVPLKILDHSALVCLDQLIERKITSEQGICLLLDRFDALFQWADFNILAGNLRALRDSYKYRLTYVAGMRRLLDEQTELAELFFGHTIWLGPLSKSDALWSAGRDLERLTNARKRRWCDRTLEKLIEFTGGYPSLLRAACEAYASGSGLTLEEIRMYPSVARCVAEFWVDKPGAEAIRRCGLEGNPLLGEAPFMQEAKLIFDATQLTLKENLLLDYLLAHADEVCNKDDLIQAVWPEDKIFERGVRDESLAQLIRRLRVKIEKDPANPSHIHTIPGRGYVFRL